MTSANSNSTQLQDHNPSESLQAVAKRFYDLGANITVIGEGEKRPIHKWQEWQHNRQSLEEFNRLPWNGYEGTKVSGIGVVNGSGNIRFFDFDAYKVEDSQRIPSTLIDSTLKAMGLPVDYEYVYQSGSGKGWGVMFRCDEPIPSGLCSNRTDKGILIGEPNDKKGPLRQLELRYATGQTIIPPSIHSSGHPYRWRYEPPLDDLASLSFNQVIEGFKAVACLQQSGVIEANASSLDLKNQIRQRFDLVDYAKLNFGHEIKEEPNGEIRILGHGGLLINPQKKAWTCFSDGQNGKHISGDCFDLVGWKLFGDLWFSSKSTYWNDVLHTAADFVGIQLPNSPINQNGSAPLAEPLVRGWPLRTLADAFEERQPINYIVDDLIPSGSLSILYGAPGTLKSMLLADLCGAVVAGQNWLVDTQGCNGCQVESCAVFWLDVDNGTRRSDERFEAIARARNLSVEASFNYVVLPTPPFNAGNNESLADLKRCIVQTNAKLIIIDNLSRITGPINENDSGMAAIMGNLRKLADELNVAIILIHHQRKSYQTNSGRAGDSLRGHSSIEASIDLALLVTRKGQEERISITPTKVRGVAVDTFYAAFEYEHKLDSTELAWAKFHSVERFGKNTRDGSFVAEKILEALEEAGEMNQSRLIRQVKDKGVTKGDKSIIREIDKVVESGQVVMGKGEYNANIYRIQNEFRSLSQTVSQEPNCLEFG